jgi:glycosyltransferase involved in cell wall biosynthesis
VLKQIPNSALGVNVVGHVTGEYGLGTAVRATLRSMAAADVAFSIKNIEVAWHSNLNQTYVNFISAENPYPINLIHINPDPGLYEWLGTDFFKGRYNIGYWAWELLQFPSAWEFAFDYFDEIWTLSNYCAESITKVTPIPVIKLPPSIDIPKPTLDREALGLPKDKFIFLFMFDFHSTITRKNTVNLIKAFQQAFDESNQDVLLVIKCSNGDHKPQQRAQVKAAAADWPSIHFIEEHLRQEEVQSLLNSCNCYVSLHRAEGFGLTMAEAMFYGKPVIATGYSSNMEFMNVGNSFLVKYKLVPNARVEGPYYRGAVWADPDIDHATSLMRYVFQNYDEAKLVGAKAARDMRTLLSPYAVGTKIRNRLEMITKKFHNDMNSTRLTQNLQGLRTEKELESEKHRCISQTLAWKQTAQQMQAELKKINSHSQPI